jgi:hypothetical protein
MAMVKQKTKNINICLILKSTVIKFELLIKNSTYPKPN